VLKRLMRAGLEQTLLAAPFVAQARCLSGSGAQGDERLASPAPRLWRNLPHYRSIHNARGGLPLDSRDSGVG
jgi:hypothetical protein